MTKSVEQVQEMFNEKQKRQALMEEISGSIPIFVKKDFESWTTEHLMNLAGRIRLEAAEKEKESAYAKVK